MNYQLKGFQFSFIIHVLVFFIIICISNTIVPMSKLIVIDFSIKDFQDRNLQEVSQKVSPDKKGTDGHERIVGKMQEETPYESSVAPSVSDTQAPVSASILSKQNADLEGERRSLDAGGITADSSGDTGMTVAYNRYLKEHFAYIRNLIIRNISYPDIARRNGWEGMLMVSFIISENGYARDIRIEKSSGFDVLDKNAVRTIKNVSPFPKPPVEALIKIPIVYKLTNN